MHQQSAPAGKNANQRDVSLEEPNLRACLRQVIDIKEQEMDGFIEAVRERGTLLQEKDRRFSFIHLALQEFLTACYLYDVVAKKGVDQNAVLKALAPRLDDDWWREPLLLLAGYWALNAPQGAQQFRRQLATVDGNADARFAAAELAGTAALEVRVDEPGAIREHCADSIAALLDSNAVLTDSNKPTLRARVGDVLARLGNPRFDPRLFYLPADDKLGFEKIAADKDFKIGTRSSTAHRRQVKESTGNDARDDGINDAFTPTHEFYIARYPVTVAQFMAYRDARKVRYAKFAAGDEAAFSKPGIHPVQSVHWHEALRYCEWFDQKAARREVV